MQFWVQVKSRARATKVLAAADGSLVVWVTAAPTDGEANEAVRRAVADHFDVGISLVRLIKGHTSKRKLFEVS